MYPTPYGLVSTLVCLFSRRRSSMLIHSPDSGVDLRKDSLIDIAPSSTDVLEPRYDLEARRDQDNPQDLSSLHGSTSEGAHGVLDAVVDEEETLDTETADFEQDIVVTGPVHVQHDVEGAHAEDITDLEMGAETVNGVHDIEANDMGQEDLDDSHERVGASFAFPPSSRASSTFIYSGLSLTYSRLADIGLNMIEGKATILQLFLR